MGDIVDEIRTMVNELDTQIKVCFDLMDKYGNDILSKEQHALLEERYRIREMLINILKKEKK